MHYNFEGLFIDFRFKDGSPGVTIMPETRKNSKCHARSYLGCARGHPIYTNGDLLSVPDALNQYVLFALSNWI